MTAVIAAVAVLAVASVSALAAATKPGTSKATAQVARRADTRRRGARRRARAAPPRAPAPEGRRRGRGADDDAAAGHDTPRRRSRLPRPRSRRPPSSRRRLRPRSPPAAHERRVRHRRPWRRSAPPRSSWSRTPARARGRAPAGGRARRDRPRVQSLPPRFGADAGQRRGGAPHPDQPRCSPRRCGVALRAAEQTDGAVDPTVAPALVALGYDRDFAAMDADAADDVRGIPAAGWRSVALDARRRLLRLSPGCRLDLGATAKALAADRAARAHRRGDGLPHARRPRWRRGDGRAAPRRAAGWST